MIHLGIVTKFKEDSESGNVWPPASQSAAGVHRGHPIFQAYKNVCIQCNNIKKVVTN